MSLKRWGLLVAATLVATGCGTTSYEDAEVLAEEVGCTDTQPVDRAGAVSAVECASTDHGDPLVVATFTDSGAFDRFLEAQAARIRPTVHGDNWAITGPDAALVEVQDEVGGTLTAVDG